MSNDESCQASAPSIHPALKKHSEMFESPRVIKVTDHVYVGFGYAIANMIMVEGTDGIVIVDTTESGECALTILKEFRKITNKPIKGIVLTHFHAVLMSECTFTGGNMQLGFFLEHGTERVCCGLGSYYHKAKNTYQILPTDTFNDTLSFELAGVNFTLLHTPGETNDQITVWLPDWGVVMPADNIYKTFPNLFALRGTPPRNCEDWYQSLDKVRRLKPKHMVPSHTEPVSGEKEIYDIITHYRDAIQFINDQTCRLLNNGYEVDEIVERVRLPPSLASHPYLQEHYGMVCWSVRSVITGQIGWFDRDSASLFPLTKQANVQGIQELLNRDFEKPTDAIEKMLIVAEESLKAHIDPDVIDEKLQWGLKLSTQALRLTDSQTQLHNRALSIAFSCLDAMAAASKNPCARNLFIVKKKALVIDGYLMRGFSRMLIGKIKNWPIMLSMEKLRFNFRAEVCDDLETKTVIFVFPDVGQVHSYSVRHCILEYQNTPELIPKEYDVKITLHSDRCKELLTNEKSFASLQEAGNVELEGQVESFVKFMDLLDVGINIEKRV